MLQNGERLTWAVPETPGVYMWKISLRVPYYLQSDPQSFTAWLDRLCRMPNGAIGERRLGHSILLRGLEIRGGGLPSEKRNSLLGFLTTHQRRKWMVQLLEELSRSLPAIYVGETNDLAARAMQHMNGLSDFGAVVHESPDLDWADLDLHYLPIGSGENEERQAPFRKTLEYVFATLTIAGYTRRPG